MWGYVREAHEILDFYIVDIDLKFDLLKTFDWGSCWPKILTVFCMIFSLIHHSTIFGSPKYAHQYLAILSPLVTSESSAWCFPYFAALVCVVSLTKALNPWIFCAVGNVLEIWCLSSSSSRGTKIDAWQTCWCRSIPLNVSTTRSRYLQKRQILTSTLHRLSTVKFPLEDPVNFLLDRRIYSL